MATYAEYLKSCGATEEEIKVLDTPTARRAYERMEESVVRNAKAVEEQKKSAEAYEGRVNEWFEEEKKKRSTIDSELITARARADKAESVLRTAHEKGMIDVAKDLGYDFSAPAPPKKDNGTPEGFDPAKFITADRAAELLNLEGDAIATMSDIAAEHVYLFGAPLRNARELRREAMARKLSVMQVWEEKYGVVKARADKEAAAKKADEDRIRKDEREKADAEWAAKVGTNPFTRTPEASRSFLIPRKEANRDKQPWDQGVDGESGSGDRVRRATENALKSQTH